MEESMSQTSESFIVAANELLPFISEKRDETSKARRVPDDIGQRLINSGLWSMIRPARFGGPEVSLDVVYRVTQTLALADAAVAWVYVVLSTHDLMVGCYPKAVQEKYWKSARSKCASSFNPTGKVTAARDGFVLSGKWSYCSGVDFCDWVILGGIAGTLPGESKIPDMRYFLVPMSQAKIVDDWNVMGLEGTGSKSVVLEEVFVPNEHVVSDEQLRTGNTPGQGLHESDSYRAKGWAVYIFCFPAIPVAAVRSAYEDFVTECRTRAKRREPPFELRKSGIQMGLAEAGALLDCAELLFDRALTETFAEISRTGDVSNALRRRNRRDLNFSVKTARHAAEMLMSMGSGRATYQTNRVQRALRDIHALSVHPSMNWETPALAYGAHLLGENPADPFA